MSLIGQVFNKALSKSISVYIAESGDSFKRLTGAIGQDVKEAALAKVKEGSRTALCLRTMICSKWSGNYHVRNYFNLSPPSY